jgi:hypothetical protein
MAEIPGLGCTHRPLMLRRDLTVQPVLPSTVLNGTASAMRESRTYGSVRGALRNGRPYRERLEIPSPAGRGRETVDPFARIPKIPGAAGQSAKPWAVRAARQTSVTAPVRSVISR